MESSPIDSLPMELLTMCFDDLKIREQLAVMSTCEKWYHILSDKRYLKHRRFNLSIDNICNPDGDEGLWHFEKMQRYRAFGISCKLCPREQETQYLNAVRAFLSRTGIMDEVEDLLLNIDQMPLDILFIDSQEWYFPKLEKITYRCHKYDGYKHTVFLNAPNLTQPELTDWEFTVSPWAINRSHEDVLFKTIEVCTLTDLRSLTLTITSRGQHWPLLYRTGDTFNQLKYLKVCDIMDAFMGLHIIFQTAINLETLIVIGKEICSDVYNKIGNMQQLKKLCLLVNIIRYPEPNGLSLPNLEILTTNGTYLPLESVPKLNRLCIIDHSKESLEIISNTLHKYLSIVSKQLESLHLINVGISEKLIESLRECINLKSLTMRCINVKDDDVCKIVRGLPSLQNVCLMWCLLMKMPRANPESMLAVRMKNEETKAFFRKLREVHPTKYIHDIDNTQADYSKHYSEWFVDQFT